ncbi:MAG: hypothetical protein M3167_06015 [Acidobacteriota bacterium]|nr:hypothetical protein [Acidobacteriota bacterium]
MKTTELDRNQVRWIVSRASQTWIDDRGRRRVTWRYSEIARNFAKAKNGAALSEDQVAGLVERRDPATYRERQELTGRANAACARVASRDDPEPAPAEEAPRLGALRRLTLPRA